MDGNGAQGRTFIMPPSPERIEIAQEFLDIFKVWPSLGLCNEKNKDLLECALESA